MNSTADPHVSVVIPVYNGAEFLAECIQSVIDQTYSAWDCTILDNCSTDATYEVAARFANADSRVRVIKADSFVGQVPNINRALRLIADHSQYCKVLQADDWMFPRCLEDMVGVAELSPSVGVVGSYSMYRDRVHHHGMPFTRNPVFPGRVAARRYLMDGACFLGSPTCVLFRSSLVRKREPFYREDTPAEDVETCLELLHENDFGFAFQLLTFNRRDNDSYWTRVQDFSPDLQNELLLVCRIGHLFMTPAELAARRTDLESSYYAMLGRALATRREPAFWKFHEKWLPSIGQKLDRGRIRRAAVKWALGSALDLKSSLQNWRARRRAKR